MAGACDPKEKRKHPRVAVEVSVDFRVPGESRVSSGIVINASESGLLFQSFKSVPAGAVMRIEVSFPTGPGQKEKFTAITQVVWKDLYLWEDLEGYQYGLQFVEISVEDDVKLKHLLDFQSNPE